jgi:hypothetical protein
LDQCRARTKLPLLVEVCLRLVPVPQRLYQTRSKGKEHARPCVVGDHSWRLEFGRYGSDHSLPLPRAVRVQSSAPREVVWNKLHEKTNPEAVGRLIFVKRADSGGDRNTNDPTNRTNNNGFRLALNSAGKEVIALRLQAEQIVFQSEQALA